MPGPGPKPQSRPVKTARRQQWEAAHPDLASLAEQVQRLSGEVERLWGLLRQHGIEPEDKTVVRAQV